LLHLTDESLRNISEASKEFYVWDTELTGFGVRVLKSGKKIFVVRLWRAPNTQKLISLGSVESMTVDAAREAAARLKHDFWIETVEGAN